MIRCTPENVRFVCEGLDHPEGLCFASDGALVAGGESGQIYRIDPKTAKSRIIARTHGFILGVCADATGGVYACDAGRNEVLRIDPDGSVGVVSTGTLDTPNDCAFDADGNLFFTESGTYHPHRYTGRLFVITSDGKTKCIHPGPFRFANGIFVDAKASKLFMVESTGPSVLEFQLDGPRLATIDPTARFELQPDTVPDGIALDEEGNIYVAFYSPDQIGVIRTNGTFEVLYRDFLAEWMNRPTNIALRPNEIYFANLGGWHIGCIEHAFTPRSPTLPACGPQPVETCDGDVPD